VEAIDTSSKPVKYGADVKSYLIEEYGSLFENKKRASKNKQYYEQ
jgi:hypothetical protein